jgi:hypothetical protein
VYSKLLPWTSREEVCLLRDNVNYRKMSGNNPVKIRK